ncbi:MAG: phosphate ABC transporter permease PstA [Clostridiales bacterium]|nr:phosphate ABC transporter permease PstA [Clostridiales bacterium]
MESKAFEENKGTLDVNIGAGNIAAAVSDSESIFQKKVRVTDEIAQVLINACALFSILLLVGITGYVFYHGIGMINLEFLTTVPSIMNGTFGIAGNIVNTLYLVVITLLIATPIGVGAAIYLNEYARPGKIVRIIEFTTETLSGIPSIIFGLFGMVVFGSIFEYSLISGAITLALMVLPLITRNTQEALKTVPDSYRIGALGMGAEKWYLIRTILLPSAMPGIVTGVVLAIGRIVGESAALLFTAGSAQTLPFFGKYGEGLIQKIGQPGGTLTIQLYLSMSNAEYDQAFGIAMILLIIVFAINYITKIIAKRLQTN